MRTAYGRGLAALVCLLLAWSGLASAASSAPKDTTAAKELRPLIENMKENPRGPFERIRWFCNDGTILPPKSFACKDHGGGRQHGEWNADTVRIRDAGFPIANVMVALTEDDFGESPEEQEHFRFLVLEQFLIDADDGWILRRARYYRGAFQVEGEISKSYAILSHLARRPEWQNNRYPLLVEAARLIQHGEETAGQAVVRGMATALNKNDAGFSELRNKIHGRPEPSDAGRVRSYAKDKGKPELADDYEALAEAIDSVAALPDPGPAVSAFAGKVRDASLAADLRSGVTALQAASSVQDRLAALSGLMARLREGLPTSGHPLDTIDLVLNLEAHVFNLGQALDIDSGTLTRRASIELMKGFARAAYGAGLLTRFEWDNLGDVLANLDQAEVRLDSYRDDLRYLDRVPGWGARRLAFYFEPAIEHMAQIEPFVREFIPDRMRGSPLLFYSRLLEPLSADALRQAGVRQQLFGQEVPSGLRVLNPGIGRGVLRTLEQLKDVPEGTADSIALVPETVSELPVVAGILTEHEGNSLSHVQLLARNLGVPNVVVGDDHLPGLKDYLGKRIMVASSPGGVVRISLDTEAENSDSGAAPVVQDRISIDVSRLDLETQDLIPTTRLGAKDQGVRVGPKAAQVGKLTQHFPGHVAPGVAVPFGLFAHALLEREVEPGGPTLFQWMTREFDEIQAIQDPVERNRKTAAVLATIRSWFETRPPDPTKLDSFHRQVQEYLGPDGSYGVFVRSDTNVEDLPGFTGAGINLTVPNVVGFENLVTAMRAVWASPFTERSFGWRQGIMNDPEHVYASVLLHKSINSDKSGVLVTADADTGSRDYITIVINEGVGGGVEGQAAESLLIRRSDGQTRLLGSATDPTKRVLLETGGSELVAASGAERLLDQQDIGKILEFVGKLPGWFENLPEEERATAVADVEFGFLGDKLMLFQIRPFVESKGAARSDYLRQMDAGLAEAATVTVD
ncbi:MAG: PEP/pyruvate-binding domain-containing protein, partial [Gammaproteobacteria bacterium]